MLEIHPLLGMPEVKAGDDLAALLADAVAALNITVAAYDVLVIAQKIVSKAEARSVRLAAVFPSPEAEAFARMTGKDPRFVELVLGESSEVVRVAPNVLITRHRGGHVMANAGIDRSNLGPGKSDEVLLLPVDADASAARLRGQLANLWGMPPAVLISDSFGRPWRIGTVNIAIGAAGLPSIVDQRGSHDRDGRILAVTQPAIADMIASAAGLVMGESAEGIPAALVRGLHWDAPMTPARALVRPVEDDLFR